MTRALFLAAAIAAAAISGAGPASADPASTCHATIPNCDIVPGMQDGVVGRPCPSWTQDTFGFDPNGNFIACVSPNRFRHSCPSAGRSPSAVQHFGISSNRDVGSITARQLGMTTARRETQ
jgi:hypothetical protein